MSCWTIRRRALRPADDRRRWLTRVCTFDTPVWVFIESFSCLRILMNLLFKGRVTEFISVLSRCVFFNVSRSAAYSMSVELIVPNCVCPGMCALTIVVFLSVASVCPCANASVCPYVGVWVLPCYSVPACVPMCVVRSLLVEFNPCVQGVTSPQHTSLHSYCSTLTFYSPPSPPTPFTFVLRGQLRKQTFSLR